MDSGTLQWCCSATLQSMCCHLDYTGTWTTTITTATLQCHCRGRHNCPRVAKFVVVMGKTSADSEELPVCCTRSLGLGLGAASHRTRPTGWTSASWLLEPAASLFTQAHAVVAVPPGYSAPCRACCCPCSHPHFHFLYFAAGSDSIAAVAT
jgi:hypothetical protein